MEVREEGLGCEGGGIHTTSISALVFMLEGAWG